jgi:hypothetical protein
MSTITSNINPADHIRLEELFDKRTITPAEQDEIKKLVKKHISTLPSKEINKNVSLIELRRIFSRNGIPAGRDEQINDLAKQNLLPLLKANQSTNKETALSTTLEKPKILIETPSANPSTSAAIKIENSESRVVKETTTSTTSTTLEGPKVLAETPTVSPSTSAAIKQKNLESQDILVTEQLTTLSLKENSFKTEIEKIIKDQAGFLIRLQSTGAEEDRDSLREVYDNQVSSAGTIEKAIMEHIKTTDKKKLEAEFESYLLPLMVLGTPSYYTTTLIGLPVPRDYFGINYRYSSLDGAIVHIYTTHIKPLEKQNTLIPSPIIVKSSKIPVERLTKNKLEKQSAEARKLTSDLAIFKENLLIRKYIPHQFANFLAHLSNFSCDELKLIEMNKKYEELKKEHAYYETHGKIILNPSALTEFNNRLVQIKSRLNEAEKILKPIKKSETADTNYQLNPVLADLKTLQDRIVAGKENFILEKDWISQLPNDEKKLRYNEILEEFKEIEKSKEKAIDAKDSTYHNYEKELKATIESQTKELAEMKLKLDIIHKTMKDIQAQFIKIIQPASKGGLGQTVSSAFSYLTGSRS